MFKRKYIFRHENGEFEAYCNPMYIRQAAAVASAECNAKFMEVVDIKTGMPLLVCVHRTPSVDDGFVFLFPEDD